MMDDPVNFTREPIIETVITPREGYNLAIRSSKGNGHEDYFVDAVEVVSFGHSFFFRSQERPSSFLVPVSDYEVIEVKEARMVLKNVAIDRSIKIGGGREAPPSRPHRESNEADSEKMLEGTAPERPPMEQRKRDNKRRRGRRGGGRPDMHAAEPRAPQSLEEAPPVDPLMGEEIPKPSSFISKLFPPPPTLIKETLSRYKLTESEDISSQALEEKPEDSLPSDPDLFEPPVDLDGDSPPEED